MTTALPAAITFDCWNTLLFEADGAQIREKRGAALHAGLARAGHSLERSAVDEALVSGWWRHHASWVSGRQAGADRIVVWTLEALGLQAGPLAEQLVPELQQVSLSSDVRALDGAPETLRRLAERGVRLALVCDTGFTPGPVVRQLLERCDVLAPLEVTVFSDEVGVPKPDPRTFRAALEPLEVAPRDALHVGDLRSTDVRGARGLGMGCVRIRATNDDAESEHADADWVVDSHAEFCSRLGL